MGILMRLMDLSKAAIHEALDKLEQPGMMLNQYLRNMQEEIDGLQTAAAQEAADTRKLEREIAYYTSLAEQSGERAKEAAAENRMAEARQDVELKLGYLEKLSGLMEARDASAQRSEKLAEQLKHAKAEYANLQAKRDELSKRARRLETESQALKAAAPESQTYRSAAMGFQHVEEAIVRREIQLEQELSSRKASEEARAALIEEELAKLRNEALR